MDVRTAPWCPRWETSRARAVALVAALVAASFATAALLLRGSAPHALMPLEARAGMVWFASGPYVNMSIAGAILLRSRLLAAGHDDLRLLLYTTTADAALLEERKAQGEALPYDDVVDVEHIMRRFEPELWTTAKLPSSKFRLHKIMTVMHAPLERTLYIDADVFGCKAADRLTEVFDMLGCANGMCDVDLALQQVPARPSTLHGGFMAVSKTPQAQRFLRLWADLFQKRHDAVLAERYVPLAPLPQSAEHSERARRRALRGDEPWQHRRRLAWDQQPLTRAAEELLTPHISHLRPGEKVSEDWRLLRARMLPVELQPCRLRMFEKSERFQALTGANVTAGTCVALHMNPTHERDASQLQQMSAECSQDLEPLLRHFRVLPLTDDGAEG